MLTMPHWPTPLWHKDIWMGLSRIEALLAALGNPERRLPPIFHVAGTNGKGSTVAFITSILRTAGYRVHSYTSPHLLRFNERIRLLGVDIDDALLYATLEECRLACEKHRLEVTFFEGTTAAAMLAMSRVPADFIVMETGMGGRLDATNVITTTCATIISTIDWDHMEYLGSELTQIAAEKAGIMRPHVPCVTGPQLEEVDETLSARAQALSCPLIAYGYDWGVREQENGFVFQSEQRTLSLPRPNLPGIHQYANAGQAIAATCLALPSLSKQLSDEVIARAITSVFWPGRLQQLTEGYTAAWLEEGWELWLDGAHNSSGMRALAEWIASSDPALPVHVIAGITKGRNCQAIFTPLTGQIASFSGVPVDAEPDSYSGEHVAREAAALGLPHSQAFPSAEAAVRHICRHFPAPGRILVCGSLYLVGDVLALHHGRNAVV